MLGSGTAAPERLEELASKLFKNDARSKLNQAVKAGSIVKEHCDVCGDTKTEAHHPDYNEPLTVLWLCRKDHATLHKGDYPLRASRQIVV